MSTGSPSGSGTDAELPTLFERTDSSVPGPRASAPSSLSSADHLNSYAPAFDLLLPNSAETRFHAKESLTANENTVPRIESNLSPTGTVAIDPPAGTSPLAEACYLTVKRALDIVVSSLLLLVFSPLLLLLSVLIKLTDGGSAFYPHTRVGEGGNEFTCYKFRSMVINADKMKANLAFYNAHDDHRTFKIPDDPRVTRIGRFMRRTSLDELPQLWNVLKGEMSLVGPRPPVVTEVEQYTLDDMQRLTVKPGLTCIWQVSGRSRLSFPEQLQMDLQYIENRSLALDLKLIILTVPAVLSADGAY